MQDIIESILKNKGGDLVQMLMSKLGFSSDQGEGFLGGLLEQLSGLVGGGKVSPTKFFEGGNFDNMLGDLDLGKLAAKA
ncbi:MAG: hypothetical protein KC983_10395, partial [Phycisphaerales bacterium]|nr:hypothetical protein [Phycisphaerales bacterium]